mmetsp:Transcript_92016/g.168756  ORF Transcript_92016/g.168756 Transcript_92016/m.168756 type:complete len:801 (-) Transcript_92016:19-2421(-)
MEYPEKKSLVPEPRVHFVGKTRASTAVALSEVAAHLQLTLRSDAAVCTHADLKGPSTAFRTLAMQGRATVEFMEGVELTFVFAFPDKRRPLQKRHDLPHVRDWLGAMLRCEGMEPPIFLVAEDASTERSSSETWSLVLRGVNEDAASVCRSLCRFGCGMGCAGKFDTCCRQCGLSYGSGVHAADCRGAAPHRALTVWQQSVDISCLQRIGVKSISPSGSSPEAEERAVAASLPDLTDLPYGGDMMQAMRAGDRDAIRKIMEARRPRDAGADGEEAADDRDSIEHARSLADVTGGKPVAPAAGASCAICYDDLGVDALAICGKAHAFCSSCLRQHVQTELEGKGVLPACPLSAECGHLLTSQQVKVIVGPGDDGKALIDICSLLQQRLGLQALGALPCAKCDDWMVPGCSRPGRMSLVECPSCKDRFCRECKRRPYHFRARCDQVPRIEGLWREWLRTGRNKYMAELAKEDEQYESMFREFETKRAEQDAMLKEADGRLEEFAAMERWKAENCKCCPKCKRVIEKVSGCDLMKCGQNYHGGDVQNGCGKSFKWSEALSYTPQSADHLSRPTREVLATPSERQKMYWTVGAPDVFVRCAMCKEVVEGPLFLCIDCHACCSCLKCANGFGAAAGGKHLPESHVFKILWSKKDLRDRDLQVLMENRLVVKRPLCARPECMRPTFNGKPGEYCSKSCRYQPICLTPGCGKPTWNGRPNGFCSKECRGAIDPSHRPRGGRRHSKPSRHTYAPMTLSAPSWCEDCEGFLWGLKEQAQCCQACRHTVCHDCARAAPEERPPCPGAAGA